MHKEFLMGNEAIALGALAAGVKVVCGYPGTPSTEVLETVAKRKGEDVHVEWSCNEKAAMEVAAGAAYAGAKALVTMKQVGLNVASDPLMSLEYIGVKGGMVVLVADDPGPISSQTEQDTRTFGAFSKVPVFDPSSVAEAYEMVQEAFDFSEKYSTPVILRPTTRIDHGYEAIEVKEPGEWRRAQPEGFVKDSSRWVIFPRLSVRNHALIEKRNAALSQESCKRNFIFREGDSSVRRGIATHGINYQYVADAMEDGACRVLRVATPFPFPEKTALEFLEGLDEVLCVEELDPVIERALVGVCGKYGLKVAIRGKLTGDMPPSGENTTEIVADAIAKFLTPELNRLTAQPLNNGGGLAAAPALPVRPPVLCAGCPHRASFYAVKVAMKGRKTLFAGDIGCYTLGNAAPLDMCDTCLCMGAGIGISQGVWRVEPDTKCFAFVGDSTFFASGITGVVNAFYNQADLTLVVLDNSTTAMTGHQPHPGTGRTMMGEIVEKVSIEKVLRAIGLEQVVTIDPLDFDGAVRAVREVADAKGVKAIIFRSPCVAITKPQGKSQVDPSKCVGCGKCIRELGCPALIKNGGKAAIDETLCTGCALCEKICPARAINSAHDLNRSTAQPHNGADVAAASTASAQSLNRLTAQPHNRAGEGAVTTTSTFRRNIVLCGVGGQGTILASRLIATAAMRASVPVRAAETIGMAQRGGSVCSHLRLGNGAHSPLVPKGMADLIIAFEPGEAVRMLPYLREGGAVVCGTRPVMPVSASIGASRYDAHEMLDYLASRVGRLELVDVDRAAAELGTAKAQNVVLLGAAARSGALGFGMDEIEEAVRERVPAKFLELNLRALAWR